MTADGAQTRGSPARFEAFRGRLLALAERNLSPLLARRVSPEDVVQETFAAALGRARFFSERPDIPTYPKLRLILFQTLATLERHHLQSAKRDACKEIPAEGDSRGEARNALGQAAAAVTGPFTHTARSDRREILVRALAGLEARDRQILTLRHFDALPNAACAARLGLSPQAASVRYVRALRRLHERLAALTEFRP